MPEHPLTNAELVILSLLCEQSMHGYQIEQAITGRNMRAWTDLATSSIYYILRRLQEKDLIEIAEIQPSEKGIPRKIFQITAKGESTWKEATLRALSSPTTTYTSFLMGLHNLWNIPPVEALEAVIQYRNWLETDLQRQRDELDSFEASFFPLDVLFEYGFVLGEAELSFLSRLIDRLDRLAKEPNSFA